MKFLISNYSSHWNTEPFYMNAALSSIGEDARLFNPQNSIYDECDTFKPDIFITHLTHISKDTIHYMLNNKNISLLINTNNIETDKLQDFADSLRNKKINAVFFGESDIRLTNSSYIKVLSSADVFLENGDGQYSIQKLIFADKEEDILRLDGTYHYTSCNQKLFDKVDFVLPINMLNMIFKNYKEIVFKGGSYIGSQVSFNAIYSGSKVIFDTKNNNDLEKIDSIFKGGKLLSSVKNKHTCWHRLKSLLSQLNNKEIVEKLEREIEKI